MSAPRCPRPTGSFVVVGVTTHPPEVDGARERLWLVPTGGGEPRPLTAPELSSAEPAPSPDGRALAFVRRPGPDAAAGGGEPQLHVLPLDGGEARRVTDLPLGVADPRWLPDGRRVVVISQLYRGALGVEATRRLRGERAKAGDRPHVTEDRVFRFWDRWLTDGEVHHVFVVDVETGAARDLTPASDQWFDLMEPAGDLDVAPGGEEIAFAANVTPPPHATLRAAIHTVPVAGGEPRCVSVEETSDARRPRYSPDGRWLVYGVKRDPSNYADRVRLVRIDRTTGEHKNLTEAWDHSAIAWELQRPGHPADRGARARPDPPLSHVGRRGRHARASSTRAAPCTASAPRPTASSTRSTSALARPPEVARVPVARRRRRGAHPLHRRGDSPGSSWAAWRRSTSPAPAAIRCTCSSCSRPGTTARAALPLVQVLHGGPYGMHGDGWHWRWNAQAFAAPGYADRARELPRLGVVRRALRRVDPRRLGRQGRGRHAPRHGLLVARGLADPARLAIAGGSFGGYMACVAADAHRSLRLHRRARARLRTSRRSAPPTSPRASSASSAASPGTRRGLARHRSVEPRGAHRRATAPPRS